jgi:bifunctional DNA-binding transcriptional regulator/antitoxin component of YhaV-PrlF toxin-antitoxin module
MTYLVGQKGQIVIAKEIRDRLGVKPGWVALQRLVGDRVEIYFLPPEHNQSLKGSLARHLEAQVGPGKEWDEARKAVWEEAARSKESTEEYEA